MDTKLTARQFKVLNYRNIDDSGWIPLERVTAFVGRNESGKTALLKALHKFNPALEEPYNAQREFPRDRFTADYVDGADWPVCRVEFELSKEFREELRDHLNGAEIPQKAILTRYYDGSLTFDYDTEVSDDPVDPDGLSEALNIFARGARRLEAPSEDQEEETQELRTELADWADGKKEAARKLQDFRTEEGAELLEAIRQESNKHAQPATADLVENLQDAVDDLRSRAEIVPIPQQLDEAIERALPVFIYFENYGILDSSVYLPRFLLDLEEDPDAPRVRTINAMFKHVNLTAQKIADLGQEEVEKAEAENLEVTPEMIQRDQQRKEERAIRLNSASTDISEKFSQWFKLKTTQDQVSGRWPLFPYLGVG